MERMSYGSPGSPGNISGANDSTYLPSFLLGSKDPSQEGKSVTPHKSNSFLDSSRRQDHYLNNGFDRPDASMGSKEISGQNDIRRPDEKQACGPPKGSLSDYSYVDGRNSYSAPARNAESIWYGGHNLSDVAVDDSLENWVTIFGFTSSQVQAVLTHFSQYGLITRTKPSASNCNWIHVRYDSSIQANDAMCRNGRLISSNLMVGVIKCSDMTVLGDYVAPKNRIPTDESRFYSASPLSPINASSNQFVRSLRSPTLIQTTAQSNGPMKSMGIASRTVQRLFGW